MVTPIIDKFNQVQKSSDGKLGIYLDILHSINTRSSASLQDLTQFLDQLLTIQSGFVIIRPVLNEFIKVVDGILDMNIKKLVFEYSVAQVHSLALSFEQQEGLIREKLANIYESQKEWLQAAKILQGATMESGQRVIPDDYKFKTYIRITKNLLEDGDTVSAETYLNRSSLLLPRINDKELKLQYKILSAKILDYKRKFLEAAQRYHELSHGSSVDANDKIQCLQAAIICAILAPAGPARSRFLSTIYKDDRSPSLSHSFELLEQIHHNRIIPAEDIKKFESYLQPHHIAKLSKGITVVSKAFIEHNLLAVSSIYANIGLDRLGNLLGLDPEDAESFAGTMISQNRLSGAIDQIDRVIIFEQGTCLDTLENWDNNVSNICVQLDDIATIITTSKLII
ncbi:hypothetical protein NADFUDRAFT_83157 [Nadsonia fulvescens var. elongata DSM 6958]|uniref:COP9 signalosome complex subunit 4 n=1 Tax=Nadsonia fulvescens var. elongata DSM 6958 TaxID=857566 RepID=A0A1E3PI23_9ASCO|nr:hypothetical protein NADFUDRAFT_83157 [Nadsonia fulvescens var. elongata DSM 6958]